VTASQYGILFLRRVSDPESMDAGAASTATAFSGYTGSSALRSCVLPGRLGVVPVSGRACRAAIGVQLEPCPAASVSRMVAMLFSQERVGAVC